MFSPSGKAFYSVLNIFFANYVLNVLSSNFRELLSEPHTILSGRTKYSFKGRTIRKLMGGGGPKYKIFAQGKIK